MEEYSCFGGGCAEVCLNEMGGSLAPYGAFFGRGYIFFGGDFVLIEME
jgi:hypothetical protein